MAQVVTIGKRKWFVGMTWRSFEKKPAAAELRSDAADLDAEWVALRVSETAIQAGYSQPYVPEDGLVRPGKLFALAAAVADARRQPWLGIYQIGPDQWWYIAVREGQAILPDGDVFGDRQTILDARAKHENFADWSFDEGNLENLVDLIAGQGRRLSLSEVRSLAPVSRTKPIAAALGGLVALSVIALWWRHHEAAIEMQREAQFAAERALIAQQAAAVSPLVSTPSPSAWLKACHDVLFPTAVSAQGWQIQSLACNADGAELVWARLDGSTVATAPPGAIIQSGDRVDQVLEFPNLAAGQDNAIGLGLSNKILYAMLQPLGVTASITADSGPAGLPGSAASSTPPPIPQETISFTLPISPFFMNLDGVPGLRLTGLSSSDQSSWIVSGVIYGR
jgi:hypothetical protein